MRRFLSISGLNSVIEVLPVVAVTAVIYWLIRRKLQKRVFATDFKTIRKEIRANEIIRLLLVCWIAGAACMTLLPTGFLHQIWGFFTFQLPNFPSVKFEKWRLVSVWWTHFVTNSGRYLTGDALKSEIMNVVENVILFVPLGIGLPFTRKRVNFLKTTLMGFTCTVFLEFVQAFIGRDGNIDDVLSNTLGAVIGYLIYLLVKAVLPKFTEKCKTSAEDYLTK